MIGYVPLYRKFKEWEWYDEANTMRLFIHCLITANHKDNKWRGITVKKGSFITSIGNLAHDLKLTKQNIRTALKNLQSTNEITVKTTHHYTVINVVNWAKYAIGNNQSNTPTNTQSNKQVTSNQHTPNTGLTTNNNDKNVNNVKNDKKKDKEKEPGFLDDFSQDFKDTFKEFKKMRTKMKSPMTEHAEKLLINKLEKITTDETQQIELLNRSIENGWKGVYESNDTKEKKKLKHWSEY